jgi:phosphonate metabolism protein PhnN/1,5-bisphosphokinase (PRPP-forming)
LKQSIKRNGKAFIVLGPSGSGKNTLINGACKNIDNLKAIKRYITRTKIDINEDYNPIDEKIFTQMKSENLFCTTWNANNCNYGIHKDAIDDLKDGKNILYDISSSIVIHINATSNLLSQRIFDRKRENEFEINSRIKRENYNLPTSTKFVENNSSIDQGIMNLTALIKSLI